LGVLNKLLYKGRKLGGRAMTGFWAWSGCG